MNSKRLITIGLIITTIIIGAIAIYVGIKLATPKQIDNPSNEAVFYKDISYKSNAKTQDNNTYCQLTFENDTVCMTLLQNYYYQFSSNFCNGGAAENPTGCSCPLNEENCADRSNWNGGLAPYEPSTVIAKYYGSKKNPEYFTAENKATKICIQRNWCNFQQIVFNATSGASACFLSADTTELKECAGGKSDVTPVETTVATPFPEETTEVIETTSPKITDTPNVKITTTNTPKPTVPSTALVSDEIDRIIIGFMLIFTGMLIYKSGLYISLGNIYWHNGGRKLWGEMVNMNDAFDSSVSNFWNGIVLIDESVEGSVNKIIYEILNFFISILNGLIFAFAFIVNTIYRTYHSVTTFIEVKVLESILKLRLFIAKTRITLSSILKLPGKIYRGLQRKSTFDGRREHYEDQVINDRKDQNPE